MTFFAITIGLTLAIIPIAVLWGSSVTADVAPLGVRVPKSRLNDRVVTKALKAFKVRSIALALLSGAAGVAVGLWSPAGVGLLVPLSFVLCVANFAWSGQPIRAAKREQDWFAGVPVELKGELMRARKVTDPIELGVWVPSGRASWAVFVVALLALIPGAVALWQLYPQLADTIPTHWGPSGEPDAWAAKSVASVFAPSFVGLGTTALMATITLAMLHGEIHPRTSRGPATMLRNHAAMRLSAFTVGLVALIVNAMFSGLEFLLYHPELNSNKAAPLAVIVGTVLVLTVGIAGLSIAWVKRIDAAIAQAGITDGTAESPDNDSHYKWGMFYYNPDDPAVVVEKRVGVGIDFNYARWQAQLAMGVLFFLPVGILIVALLA
ncbi:DUF1648 domain-containing protein [Corynebacterium sp. 153RC1]|uniref:DUF1648 domain-containing protein n=1 Tax=unclassified Corynebacterium TaxID=2624378 RepID=UPI00211D0DFB|nr:MULTISPECIES: DUF1648 domain-containing protein [unclassified Corynebacterium]MCQ9371391.1 DUF1648 domain-containing protein [Corynebacterium sp. 35RC1]MCQ9353313.1 DUF1648 domain-containing protein [Corynebacterium sp. 209RC1]MCQ9355547.1 DUF1648 domain-containing protein [Corynebacterium sp. 1222RC1]MCQ9357732.1 DUF1648 domain-containing protein [Corynebacterium sp. 122RC1]MCQ9359919.1 DUF1648 domain-containing protein [Corynebacterium sp. 142RC1]